MKTTLMKYLLIAAVVPVMALTQEPPTPPTPPATPRPPKAMRPPTPPTPSVWGVEPKFDFKYDFNFDKIEALKDFKLEEMKYKLDDLRSDKMQIAIEKAAEMRYQIEPKIQIALEKSLNFDYQHMDQDVQRAEREAQRALQESQREMQRAQQESQREMQRAQQDMQREMQRAAVEMQRAGGWGVGAGVGFGKGGYSEDAFNSARPRQGWAKEDPADSLYRYGREAINRGEYRRAAQAFSEVVKKYPRSQYALDSKYWEAFGRYRSGTTEDLKQARKLLEDPALAGLRQNEYSMDVSGLRARVLGVLAARGDSDAAKALQAEAAQTPSGSCDKEDISVRAEALSALGQMDIASAMPVVKKVLARRDDCTVELRRRALYLLGRQPSPDGISTMLDVAKNDTDQNIRREAMSWLSRSAGDQAVPMLEEMLKTSNDEQTQRSAVNALGSIDTEKARKAIRAIIERTDVQEKVRAEAISSLARDRDNRMMGVEDAQYLRALYPKVETQRLKEAVLSAVSRIEAPENEAWLLGIAKNENESPSLRAQALQRLGRMTTVSFNEIGKLYESADSREMRQQILSALSQRKEPEAIDKLVEVAKKDTDPYVRRYAINLLTRSNNPKALQGLKDLLP